MLLSERESISYIPQKIESDMEVFDSIDEMYDILRREILECEDQMTITDLFKDLSAYDKDRVYISNDDNINKISQKVFEDWSVIKNAISEEYDKENPIGRMNPERYKKKKTSALKKVPRYAVGHLNRILKITADMPGIEAYFEKAIPECVAQISSAYQKYININRNKYENGKSLKNSDHDNYVIKVFLDSIKTLQKTIKPLVGGASGADKDEIFYGELSRIWEALEPSSLLYNKVRNYVTQKPYSTQKVKLNFGKPTLLNGWAKNNERTNLGIILLKEDKYFLGIMNRNDTACIERAPEAKTGNVYKKMNYEQIPEPYKMLPKVFFSKLRSEEFNPDPELIRKHKEGTHKNGAAFNLEDCHNLIDFYKRSIEKHEDWSKYNFHFSKTNKYKEINDFYNEVSQQGYKLTFTDIDACYIDQLVEDGALYLFQIYCKDFSPCSKGTPNLHTLYWKAIFSEENLKNVVYKLQGGGEIFFRKASIRQEDVITHPKNVEILNKDPGNNKKKSVFEYDLVKDKRYTCDKFLFHVPIQMNFKASGENDITLQVNKNIHNCENIHVIGIDRGERNLLYVSVIDQAGNIVEQMSLNEILTYDSNHNPHRRNYQEKLDAREKENVAARKNWTTINSIKKLKEGYLSQVVNVICDLVIKYNAIIVLEDLNFGFKRSRVKFEKQVYQKLEKALIDKLNYYADKKKDPFLNGGLMKAYQLTEPFQSFKKLDKQTGIIFYVPAWNTSKTDPTTGFVNLLKTKYESVEKTKEFISRINDIRYDKEREAFAFDIDYNHFTYKAEGTRTTWTLYTNGERIDRFRNPCKNNQWDTRHVDLTKEFSALLSEYGISFDSGQLKQNILCVKAADFFKRLMKIITLMVQMRNTDPDKGIDKIVSPVMNENGKFFTTGDAQNLPLDADANGAYNIAKKGLWIIEKIRNTPDSEIKNVNPIMTNKEWMLFAQENPVPQKILSVRDNSNVA